MAKREIVWTKTADKQFVKILEYWVNWNKSNTFSVKLIEEVSKRTKQIAENPFIFKKVDFSETRVASMSNYSVFYKIESKRIVITAFWDNRQDSKKLLEILNKK